MKLTRNSCLRFFVYCSLISVVFFLLLTLLVFKYSYLDYSLENQYKEYTHISNHKLLADNLKSLECFLDSNLENSDKKEIYNVVLKALNKASDVGDGFYIKLPVRENKVHFGICDNSIIIYEISNVLGDPKKTYDIDEKHKDYFKQSVSEFERIVFKGVSFETNNIFMEFLLDYQNEILIVFFIFSAFSYLSLIFLLLYSIQKRRDSEQIYRLFPYSVLKKSVNGISVLIIVLAFASFVFESKYDNRLNSHEVSDIERLEQVLAKSSTYIGKEPPLYQDSLSVNEVLTSSTDSTRVYFRLSLDSVTTIDCSIYKNMFDINYLYNDGRKRINMNKLRLKDSYKAYKIINKLNTTTLKDVNYNSKTPLMSCFIQPFFMEVKRFLFIFGMSHIILIVLLCIILDCHNRLVLTQ